jgi:hypothetical protein
MNLGQLKNSLAKFPVDMDSAEVFLIFETPEGRQYELLCATGLVPIEDTAHIGLVGNSYIHKQVEDGKLAKPAGYENLPPRAGDEWKQG